MTNDIICPPIFSGKSSICTKELCQLWDNDRNQCLVRLFLSGYLKQQLMAQRMTSLYDKLQEQLDKEDYK